MKIQIFLLAISLSFFISNAFLRLADSSFDDPELEKLSEELWEILKKPTLDENYIPTINAKLTNFHSVVENRISQASTEAARKALEEEWVAFNSVFQQSLQGLSKLREEMQKLQDIKDKESSSFTPDEMSKISDLTLQ